MVEPALAAVVRVRHPEVIVAAAETHEGADFFMKCAAWIKPLDIGEIALIHGDDEIEVFQIIGIDLSRLPVISVAFALQCIGHPGIGGRTLMVADGAGGIDLELRPATCIGGELAENNLRSR